MVLSGVALSESLYVAIKSILDGPAVALLAEEAEHSDTLGPFPMAARRAVHDPKGRAARHLHPGSASTLQIGHYVAVLREILLGEVLRLLGVLRRELQVA